MSNKMVPYSLAPPCRLTVKFISPSFLKVCYPKKFGAAFSITTDCHMPQVSCWLCKMEAGCSVGRRSSALLQTSQFESSASAAGKEDFRPMPQKRNSPLKWLLQRLLKCPCCNSFYLLRNNCFKAIFSSQEE